MDDISRRNSWRAFGFVVAAALPLAVGGFFLGMMIAPLFGKESDNEAITALALLITTSTGGLLGAIFGATYVILNAIRREH